MLRADYYIDDILRATEGIKRQLAERDERINLLTQSQNLGGYKALQLYPSRNLGKNATEQDLSEFSCKTEEVRRANAVIIAHNQKVKEAIVVFMESMGFKKERSSGGWAFSKKKSKVIVNGWYGEINKEIPISDDGEYHRCCSYVGEIRRQIDEAEKLRLQAELEAKIEAEQEARAKAARAHLIQNCIKYNLSAVNLEELRDALMGRCKYLELAWHLQQNSYDSYCGFTLAEEGYNKFINHPDYGKHTENVRIAETIMAKITDNDLDNIEVFALKPYSYFDLYDMVDPTLKADFDKTVEYMRATN